MSECSHDCSNCSSNCSERTQICKEKPNEKSKIKKIIGIVSGKGGVGKSLVTSLLASSMQKKGLKTAILDADITGPSIPKVFGLKEKAYSPDGKSLLPVSTKTGIKVMSINLLLENENDPVVWRGPVIAGAVKQFYTDVVWEDVDFMFVDMPPGTGDVPLTVFQSLPVDGIIVVTSPQELVSMIVNKAVKMANMMSVPVLGIVENYSYLECPHCNEKINVFGESKIDKIAQGHNIQSVSKIPINSTLAKKCDAGLIEEFDGNYLSELLDLLVKISN